MKDSREESLPFPAPGSFLADELDVGHGVAKEKTRKTLEISA